MHKESGHSKKADFLLFSPCPLCLGGNFPFHLELIGIWPFFCAKLSFLSLTGNSEPIPE